MQSRHLLVAVLTSVLLLSAVPPAGGIAASGPAAPSPAPAAQDEEPPRAEAGVDQVVQRNGSVLLDATPSFAPDGEIEDYTWSIETPDGQLITPSCDNPSCRLARFQAPQLGTYEVLLRVRDSNDRYSTDTMYVDVVPRGPFGVALERGPNAMAGSTGNLTARIAPGDRVVDQLVWLENGRELERRDVSDLGGVYNRSQYLVPGAEYTAVAVPEVGANVSDSWRVPAPGRQSQFLPADTSYPYIVGPRIITGEADSGDTIEGVTYRVRSRYPDSITRTVWLEDGLQQRSSTQQAETTLEVGESTIEAEITVGDEEVRNDPHHSDANRSRVPTGETRTASADVVYDPAPSVSVASVTVGEDSVLYRFSASDQYNDIDQIDISLGDSTTTYSEDSQEVGKTAIVSIPEDEYGTTSSKITVIDERGQTARWSTTIKIRQTSGSSSPPPYRRP